MKKSHLKQFIKEEIRSVLQESINEMTSSQAIEAGKDLIPIIKKWTAKDEDYLSFAYDKWQELLVKKYRINPLVAIDIRNHLYSIHNRHNLDRLHNVAYGVINKLTESVNESKYRVEYITQDGEKAKSRVYNSEEEAEKKEKQLVDTSGIKQAKIVKVEESINEDQFEASLSDPKKYKMGTMWFKRWFKPKKEQDGWTWDDDGRYIWLTRPDMNRPTVRFEKETGLLQGNWVDPKEMQWE